MPDHLTEASLDEDRRRSRLGEAGVYHSEPSLWTPGAATLSWKCPRPDCPTKLWQLKEETEQDFRTVCERHAAWHTEMDATKPPEPA
jgi:hypothetical protein